MNLKFQNDGRFKLKLTPPWQQVVEAHEVRDARVRVMRVRFRPKTKPEPRGVVFGKVIRVANEAEFIRRVQAAVAERVRHEIGRSAGVKVRA